MGRGPFRKALTLVARQGYAHHWPAHGWQACSALKVVSSLSRGHRQEDEGVGGKVGQRPALTQLSLAEESKRIPMPSHEASPPRTEPMWPLPWVYHTACGYRLFSSWASAGHWAPGSPPATLTHPSAGPCWGPLTMPWAPWRPGPVTLICTSTSQAEKRTGTVPHTAPLRFCMDGTSRTSSGPRMTSVDPCSSGPGQSRSLPPPSFSPTGLGQALGGGRR